MKSSIRKIIVFIAIILAMATVLILKILKLPRMDTEKKIIIYADELNASGQSPKILENWTIEEIERWEKETGLSFPNKERYKWRPTIRSSRP